MPPPSPPLRDRQLDGLRETTLDALIIGGGINGAVSAAALAARGLRVGLVERGDFACRTSQASSNLAWGGMKYLESGEVRLVRDLCRCRNRLMAAYPSTVREIRILTMVERGFRWHPLLLYLGAWLYWLIGGAFTRRPRYIPRRRLATEEPAFDGSHAWGALEHSESLLVDTDARFVFGFVRRAIDAGAACANYVEAVAAERDADGWRVTLRDVIADRRWTVRARALINAAGPWADGLAEAARLKPGHRHVLSKGSHLIVPRLTEKQRVLSCFTDDGRLFFVLPLGARTMIGTTDTAVDDPDVAVDAADRAYLLDNVRKRVRGIDPEAIIAERSGVRPLVLEVGEEVGEIDWLKLSRKHAVDVDREAKAIAIFGGKLTDCLNVGDEVAEALADLGLPGEERGGPWFGEPDATQRQRFRADARGLGLDAAPDVTGATPADRIWRRHGTRAAAVLDHIRRDPDMAERLIGPYTAAEIHQMGREELIVRFEDFLRRRTELALVFDRETLAAHPGLWRACRLIFADAAEAQWRATFDRDPPTASAA